MTTGGQVRPRALAMKAVLVPLPAPGAPPRRMISFGKRRFSRPTSASRACQTEPKISWASLISKSVSLPAVGSGVAGGRGSAGMEVGM